MKIIFATHNLHKAEEAQKILGADYQVVNLHDLQCPEIPETAQTLEGNAIQKAQFVLERYYCDCFADDTGLEIEALDNRPGVYSARYAGENCSFEDNMNKVIEAPSVGEILSKEFMIPLGLSAYKLAQGIFVPVSRIQDILHGRRKITADTSLRLAK